MTQYGFEPLSPEDSGSTLLERLNGLVPALLTNHKGAARPGYVQPGMLWIDDSGAEWLLNIHDGANDVFIARIDPATHAVVLPKLSVGAGLSIDGVNGTAADPATGDLSADRLLGLNLAAFALDQVAWSGGVATDEAPISPAKLKATIDANAAPLDPGFQGIGSITLARLNTGVATIVASATVAGSGIKPALFTSNGVITTPSYTLNGTWRNIGPTVSSDAYSMFQRIA